jgi:hypothetical protein
MCGCQIGTAYPILHFNEDTTCPILFCAGDREGSEIIVSAFQEAARSGLNVLRTMAHTIDPEFAFQARGRISVMCRTRQTDRQTWRTR